MNKHPKETDLALMAGGECGRISEFFLRRHVRDCRECTAVVSRFEIQREEMRVIAEPVLDWNRLASEMKANIRLGIEAGECVREGIRVERPMRGWNPRLGVAFASLAFLVAAALTMNSAGKPVVSTGVAEIASATPVLKSSVSGLELRDGASSITLLGPGGPAADQTANADGGIRASSVENGTVTITNVSFTNVSF